MDAAGQMRARLAAAKFIDANAGPNRLMAVVNYNCMLEISQNFTADADRLRQVVSGVRFNVGPSFGNYGNRNSLLALSTLAKNLADVPGRKILVLLTGGFIATAELMPDITAAIAMCNKSNVAIYPIDVGGLQDGMPSITQPGRGGRGIGGGGRIPMGFNLFGGSRWGFPGGMVAAFQGSRPGGGAAPGRRGPGGRRQFSGRRIEGRGNNRRRRAGQSGRRALAGRRHRYGHWHGHRQGHWHRNGHGHRGQPARRRRRVGHQ